MGRGRRLAACVSLLASAAGFAWLGVENLPHWFEWQALAFAGGLGAAAVALTRKNLVAQILARGLTWILFAPTAIVTSLELLRGRLHEPLLALFALSSGAALFLARPMLSTPEARRAFAPTKFRRSFLVACTAAVSVGLLVGMIAFEDQLRRGHVASGLALGALGASLIASAVGVVRMRGWGVALAGASSIASLVAAGFVGEEAGVGLAATALPGMLFVLPIVLAKLGVGDAGTSATASSSSFVRVSLEDELPSRVRVSEEDRDAETADADADAVNAVARAARLSA